MKTTGILVNYYAESGIKLAPEFTFDNSLVTGVGPGNGHSILR